MSDLEKILLTSMLTILGGVVVFVVGQLLSKFVIEPIHELRKAIGEVRYNLLFFAPDILTPIGRTRESRERVRDALRTNSSDLYIRAEDIPFYPLTSWVSCGSVPRREKVADAAKWLSGIRGQFTCFSQAESAIFDNNISVHSGTSFSSRSSLVRLATSLGCEARHMTSRSYSRAMRVIAKPGVCPHDQTALL